MDLLLLLGSPAYASAVDEIGVGISPVWPGMTYLLLAIAVVVGAAAIAVGTWRPWLFEAFLPFAAGFGAAWAAGDGSDFAGILLLLLALVGGNLALWVYFRLGEILVAAWDLVGRAFATRHRLAVGIRRIAYALAIGGSALFAASTVELEQARLLLAAAAAAAMGSVLWKLGAARGASSDRRSRLPLRVRRLTTGIVVGLVLNVVYAAVLYLEGSFEFRCAAALMLLATGIVLTACWPRLGDGILTCTLGGFLLSLPWHLYEAVWPALALAAVGLISQWLLLRFSHRSRVLKAVAGHRPPSPSDCRPVMPAAVLATGLAVAVSLTILLFSPVVRIPDAEPHAGRLGRLQLSPPSPQGAVQENLSVGGGRETVGLVARASNVLYLGGMPRALVLVDAVERPAWRTRLAFLVRGRVLDSAIERLRGVKEAAEIARLERSAEIVSTAFEKIVGEIRPGIGEGTIADLATRTMLGAGAEGLSFPSIVGAGYHATLPHYSENAATMQEGLVVIDIGCSFEGYASDMTRTFPVNGVFTGEQRKIYGLVLAAQRAAIAACRPGVAFRELDRIARSVIEQGGYGKAFLHSLGHHVGLEVHDPRHEELAPGMVITLEPGIYLPGRALGARIEDTFVVTEDGCRALTRFAVEPDAIEALMTR